MKIIVIGATGTIGSEVVKQLENQHKVLRASRNGEVQVDLGEPDSIKKIFQQNHDIDGIICAAGQASFGTLDSLDDDDFKLSLNNKLMGQINLVREGRKHINNGGFITLTSGILAHNPSPHVPLLTMINLGLEGFVQAAAQDMPNQIKLNGVCPPMAQETAIKMGWGQGGIPASEIANYYIQSIQTSHNGKWFGPSH